MDMRERRLVEHLANIGAIQKVETVTPFGFTVIRWLVSTVLGAVLAIMVLALIWNYY